MAEFSSEIFADINFRRSEKSSYGVVQDEVIIKHSTELERGSGFQEAESIYRTTQTQPSTGEVLYQPEDLPFTVIGEDISTSIIGSNYSKIKGFSIYNRSSQPLYFRLPFFTGQMRVGASGEVHSSNMDGWVVSSGDEIGISGNSGQVYDLLFLSAPIPFDVTGSLNANYTYISPVVSTGYMNYSFSGQLSIGFTGNVGHTLNISSTGTFNYSHYLDITSTGTANYSHQLDVTSLAVTNYSLSDITPIIRSILNTNYSHYQDVTQRVYGNYSFSGAVPSGDYGMLFGIWF